MKRKISGKIWVKKIPQKETKYAPLFCPHSKVNKKAAKVTKNYRQIHVLSKKNSKSALRGSPSFPPHSTQSAPHIHAAGNSREGQTGSEYQ
jgi:hypothetical protein